VAELSERVPGAGYHRATRTLNVPVGRIAGSDLPAHVERALLDALGEERPSVTIAG
jgi:hypothetical protein